MQKIYGAESRQDGLYCIGRNKYELIYGYGQDENGGWNWRHRFTGKPTLQEVEALLRDTINAETDEKILSGFTWNGLAVWLSSENQFNYKAAYDLAFQTEGATLPVTFKFGTDEAPVYYEFADIDELAHFYLSMQEWVSKAISDGWKEKDYLRENLNIFE